MKGRHSQAIPADVLAQVQSKIDEAAALIAPYLLPLTPEERRDLPKMGPKTLSFVELAYDLAKKNPALLPAYLNISDFGIDFEEARGLWTLESGIQQLGRGVSDIETLSGSESYQAALIFYKYVKEAALHDVPNAETIYQELKARYPSRGKAKKDDPEA